MRPAVNASPPPSPGTGWLSERLDLTIGIFLNPRILRPQTTEPNSVRAATVADSSAVSDSTVSQAPSLLSTNSALRGVADSPELVDEK